MEHAEFGLDVKYTFRHRLVNTNVIGLKNQEWQILDGASVKVDIFFLLMQKSAPKRPLHHE